MNHFFFLYIYVNDIKFVLTIFFAVKPLKVEILGKDQILSAGKMYDVKCQSIGSKPAAILTWWKSSKQLKGLKKNVSDAKNLLPCVARSKNVPRSNEPHCRFVLNCIPPLNHCFEIRETFSFSFSLSRLHNFIPLYYIN